MAIPRSPIRYDVELPVRYRTTETSSWADGDLLNLSEGGLCLVAKAADLLPGQEIELAIETTDKFLRTTSRLVRGTVIWTRNGRHGVEFKRQAARRAAAKGRRGTTRG